jgi:hypothetical protein
MNYYPLRKNEISFLLFVVPNFVVNLSDCIKYL